MIDGARPMMLHDNSKVLKSEVITILGSNSNSDKNIVNIIHVKVILTHTTKRKFNIP